MAAGEGRLTLPERGVTVLTGANGAGKSRFIEAVAYGLWGETLRGESPWREGEAGQLSLVTGSGSAARTVTARGKKQTHWNGEAADTPSRTQELISAAIPEYDFWRRTHVFSSSDAAHFSGATDGERKRVMELLLGLDVFDRAAEACSKELSEARLSEGSALRARLEATGRAEVARATLTALGAYAAFVPVTAPVEPPRGEPVVDLSEELHARRSEILAAQSTLVLDQRLATELAELTAKAREVKQEHSRALAGRCSQCGAEWAGRTAGMLSTECAAVEADRVAASNAWTKEQARVTAERAELTQKLTALHHSMEDLRSTVAAWREKQAVHAAWSKQRESWEAEEVQRRALWEQGQLAHQQRVAAANLALFDAQEELELAEETMARWSQHVLELEATSAVLGLRGLRGHVLGHALEGVEHVANYWLRQLYPSASMQLRADSAGKIALTLDGFAGGRYGAASTGQRRRVDAPLLLALAEVAGAGAGGPKGTLWLDELFDGLDDEGQALVARALGELGESQSVVVVTHSAELARSIPAVQRLVVRDGAVEPL